MQTLLLLLRPEARHGNCWPMAIVTYGWSQIRARSKQKRTEQQPWQLLRSGLAEDGFVHGGPPGAPASARERERARSTSFLVVVAVGP